VTRVLVSALVGLVTLAGASAASAQHVSVDIRGGIVTLDARDATLREILNEWSRVGGVKIINLGDRALSTPPVTLLLRDTAERQALDILLREVGGYLLFPRREGTPGTSSFGQLLIVPAATGLSATRTVVTPGSRAADARPGAAPAFRSGVEPADDPDAPDASDSVDGGASVDLVNAEPAPEAPANRARSGGAPRPGDDDYRPPTPLLPPSQEPDASNPFGRVSGSAVPGAIAPSGPPPGVVYPPVTNPDLVKGFVPGTPLPPATPK
jgi:hypothetical protein